jgi:hypothetical protein
MSADADAEATASKVPRLAPLQTPTTTPIAVVLSALPSALAFTPRPEGFFFSSPGFSYFPKRYHDIMISKWRGGGWEGGRVGEGGGMMLAARGFVFPMKKKDYGIMITQYKVGVQRKEGGFVCFPK